METPAENHETDGLRETQGWGAVIGIVIIVLLLCIGGLYFFLSGQNEGAPAPDAGAGRV